MNIMHAKLISSRIFMLLLLALPLSGFSQTDPIRAGTFLLYENEAKKILKTQAEVQSAVAAGYVYVNAETDGLTSFNKQFNQYLDNFHDVLTYCAEAYGMYYEINRTIDIVGELAEIVRKYPDNTLAVTFSAKRNSVYINLVATSVDVVEDLKKVLYTKATEMERLKAVLAIRPKIRNMNKALQQTALYIRYTCLADVWNDIMGRYNHFQIDKRRNITAECMERWQVSAGIKRK